MLLFSSQECQTKHWQDDHKSKCKPMNADKLSFGLEANSKKSSGFGRISLVPTRKKLKKVIGYTLWPRNMYASATFSCVAHLQGQVLFSYDEFLNLYDRKDFDFIPCGLMNCGNRYGGVTFFSAPICLLHTCFLSAPHLSSFMCAVALLTWFYNVSHARDHLWPIF